MIVGGIGALALHLYWRWRALQEANEGKYPPTPTREQVAQERQMVAADAAGAAVDDYIAGLFLYPIKSCAQVPVQAATFDARVRRARLFHPVHAPPSSTFPSPRAVTATDGRAHRLARAVTPTAARCR